MDHVFLNSKRTHEDAYDEDGDDVADDLQG
jgi:hypothetical protein